MVAIIKDLCKAKGLKNLHELETAIGVGQNTIYKWDSSPTSIEKVLKVADYFGVSVDFLLERQEILQKYNFLSQDEDELLQIYRAVSIEGKAAILTAARAFAGQVDYTKKDAASVTA